MVSLMMGEKVLKIIMDDGPKEKESSSPVSLPPGTQSEAIQEHMSRRTPLTLIAFGWSRRCRSFGREFVEQPCHDAFSSPPSYSTGLYHALPCGSLSFVGPSIQGTGEGWWVKEDSCRIDQFSERMLCLHGNRQDSGTSVGEERNIESI